MEVIPELIASASEYLEIIFISRPDIRRLYLTDIGKYPSSEEYPGILRITEVHRCQWLSIRPGMTTAL
ncbi:hypothetical protein D3C71_1249380 [compost metagenome]